MQKLTRHPRVANRLLKRARDFAQIKANNIINDTVALQALEMLEVDALGLDEADRLLLRTMVEKFDGSPVGLDTLAAAISEEAETIEDVYEPYLMQIGFLQRTPRGRVITPAACRRRAALEAGRRPVNTMVEEADMERAAKYLLIMVQPVFCFHFCFL